MKRSIHFGVFRIHCSILYYDKGKSYNGRNFQLKRMYIDNKIIFYYALLVTASFNPKTSVYQVYLFPFVTSFYKKIRN